MRTGASDLRHHTSAAASLLVNRGHVVVFPLGFILALLFGLLSVVMPPVAALALFFACALIVSWVDPFVAFSCFMLLLPFHNMARRLLSSQLLVSGAGLSYFSLWKELLLLALILALVFRKTLSGEVPILDLYKPDVWFGALAVFSAAYVLLAPSLEIGLFGFRNYFAAFAVLYIVRLLPLSLGGLKRLLVMMLFVGAIVGVFGVIQANVLGLEFLRDYGFADESGKLAAVYTTPYRPGYPRAASTLASPNELGVYMALMVLVATAMMSMSRKWGGRTWYVLCLAALIPGLAFTFSRSALGMVVVGLLAVPAFELFRRRKQLRFKIKISQLMAILLILVLIAGVGHKIGLVDRMLGAVTVLTKSLGLLGGKGVGNALEDPSAGGKLTQWAYYTGYVVRHPLGIGIGMAGSRAAAKFGLALHHAENTYLQVALELGLIGLLLYLGFWRGVVAFCESARRRVQGSDLRPLADMALGVVVGTLVAYMTIGLAQNFVFSCYLLFVVGIAFRVPELAD